VTSFGPCRRGAVLAVLSVVSTGAPVAAADPPPGPQPGGPEQVAEGHYTDPGWVYFIPAETLGPANGSRGPRAEPITGVRDGHPVQQFGCGIGPDGTVGCDAVPDPVQMGTAPPVVVPPGANQVIATPGNPAEFRHSDTLTFTRNVDMLRSGYQLVNGEASCHVGWQGSVSCTTGIHGFTQYSYDAYLH
jgi:hypothetical protein